MATASIDESLSQIGETAGAVWNYLSEHGPCTAAKLAREVEGPRDLVMQSIGWLAREGKLAFREGPRSRVISLSE